MENVYALVFRPVGVSDQSTFNYDSGAFPRTELAIEHFIGRGETLAYEDKERREDYIGEVFFSAHNQKQTLVARFRIQRQNEMALRHYPGCSCCQAFMRKPGVLIRAIA